MDDELRELHVIHLLELDISHSQLAHEQRLIMMDDHTSNGWHFVTCSYNVLLLDE